MKGQKVDRAMMDRYAAKVKNWGKWGPNDELGTVNYITAQDIIQAAHLVKKGKVFSLAIPFGAEGPQFGDKGRINPTKTMIATGTDAICGRQDAIRIRYADDMVTMPTQSATHWDALGHIFFEERNEKGERKVYMWNGYSPETVNCSGCEKCGIQNYKDKMVGRGIPRGRPGCGYLRRLGPRCRMGGRFLHAFVQVASIHRSRDRSQIGRRSFARTHRDSDRLVQENLVRRQHRTVPRERQRVILSGAHRPNFVTIAGIARAGPRESAPPQGRVPRNQHHAARPAVFRRATNRAAVGLVHHGDRNVGGDFHVLHGQIRAANPDPIQVIGRRRRL